MIFHISLEKRGKRWYLRSGVTDLHKMWQTDWEYGPDSQVHSCYKFRFYKSKMADDRLLENRKIAISLVQNGSVKRIGRPPSWIYRNWVVLTANALERSVLCRRANFYDDQSSVTGRYCSETTGQIELVFATDAFFYLSYTMLYRNSGISTIWVLQSGTWSQSLHWERFAMARQSSKPVVNLARRRKSFVDHTCVGRRAADATYTPRA